MEGLAATVGLCGPARIGVAIHCSDPLEKILPLALVEAQGRRARLESTCSKAFYVALDI